MGRARHRGRHRRRVRGWVVAVAAATFLSVLAGAAFAGYRYDRGASTRILPGVRVAGVAVGGMTRAQALTALRPHAESVLGRQVRVRAGGRTWRASLRDLGTEVDLEAAVDRALALALGVSWPARLLRRVFDRPTDRDLDVAVTHDRGAVERFVGEVAAAVRVPARDAHLDVVDARVVTTSSAEGLRLERRRAARTVMRALRDRSASIRLPTARVLPSVTERDLGKTILLRVGENRLHLYDGLELVRSYEVATGMPEYPTPLGRWVVVNKRMHPTWVNPAPDGWGRGSPAVVPPGPGNPLGTRALDLNAPGIRIHGTYDPESIGTYASHGCIRMRIPESEELFELVEVGTPVFIVA